MKRAALDYIATRGWVVFPCFPCSKVPASPHGLKDATACAEKALDLWEGVWRKWRIPSARLNLAVATGQRSGVFVLDVDGEKGRGALADLEAAHGPLPATLTTLTRNGRHLYFQHPGRPVRNSQAKLGSGLDIKGDGGAAMLPPSVHPSDRITRYAWSDAAVPIAPAPEWLVDLITREPDRVRPAPSRAFSSDQERWSEVEVRRMLDVLDPSLPREDWIRVGMALHAGDYPFDLFDEWSAGCPEKYDARDCAAQWRSFKAGPVTMGTLCALAKQGGWSPER
ncbi:bifunctional DNA primase/polymerase [Rubellimicrobium aerolatum]|uniref:Bifunctional DNA primase/polymerase n=1 Tax=Rubellimicrobium aerolatum TaxID=490979 RepID=A0ABW0SET4_9RHOB|nr:bifunctional DNA primase/polymerase [Rubellimicrobium aerolatum]MBP1806917.1 hypothetical protein [Rubellimicrobium aerolatum]